MSEPETIVCPYCEGDGKITVDDTDGIWRGYPCYDCNETGRVAKDRKGE